MYIFYKIYLHEYIRPYFLSHVVSKIFASELPGAKGFSQEEGIDYFDTFLLVVKMTSLRLLFAFATIYDYHHL